MQTDHPIPDRIGLIADSHGNLEATAEAIRLLRRRGASIVVHLGDFCDSVRHDGAAAMVALLEENAVLAVKGNNDFLVENLLADIPAPAAPEAEQTLAFLRRVPMTRTLGGLHFAHSLPFDALRSFYEPIDTGNTLRAVKLFAETDFPVLFCGHSHWPVLFRKTEDRVTREAVPSETRLRLVAGGFGDGDREPFTAAAEGPGRPGPGDAKAGAGRFIVVVGAAEDGECALYDRAAGVYERLRISNDRKG